MRILALFCGLALANPLAAEVTSRASVSVSDGTRYQITTVYRDQHHALFHASYPEQIITQVVEGESIWQRVGDERSEGSPFVELFVLGHQFHAQLLWPEQFFVTSVPQAGIDETCQCRLTVATDRFGNVARLQGDAKTGRTVANTTQIKEGPLIKYRFSNWREVETVQLPFSIQIDDGERVFEYNFQEVRLEAGAAWNKLVTQ